MRDIRTRSSLLRTAVVVAVATHITTDSGTATCDTGKLAFTAKRR